MTPEALRNVLEAAMLSAGRALSLDDFLALFEGSGEAPDRTALREALAALADSLDGRALELVEVASGWRLQVRREYSAWLGGLFAERPPRYSRALMETLALIAYRQPITRGEIEDVRGVAVSTNIIKTLMEREWIRVLGHREVPGRPALYGTTREFLDHFGLKSLDGLPPLAEVRDLDRVEPDLFGPPRAGHSGGSENGEPGAPKAPRHDATSPGGEPGADAAGEVLELGGGRPVSAGVPLPRGEGGTPTRDAASDPEQAPGDGTGDGPPGAPGVAEDVASPEPESAGPDEAEPFPTRSHRAGDG